MHMHDGRWLRVTKLWWHVYGLRHISTCVSSRLLVQGFNFSLISRSHCPGFGLLHAKWAVWVQAGVILRHGCVEYRSASAGEILKFDHSLCIIVED